MPGQSASPNRLISIPQVRNTAVPGKALVCGDKESAVGLDGAPEFGIFQSLIDSATDVAHFMTSLPQIRDGHSWDILVDEDPHKSVACNLNWGDLFLGKFGGIVQTRRDVSSC